MYENVLRRSTEEIAPRLDPPRSSAPHEQYTGAGQILKVAHGRARNGSFLPTNENKSQFGNHWKTALLARLQFLKVVFDRVLKHIN